MRLRVRTRTAIAAVACAAIFAAETAEPRWRELNHEARAAIERKDYASLKELLAQLQPLMPGNPTIAYNMAAVSAKLGNRTEALREMRDLVGMGLFFDFRKDPDFASVIYTAEYAALEKRMWENKQSVTHSQLVATLPEPDLIPEDIACDPATHRFFVSSVRKSKIITIDGKEFAKAPWPVMALRVDEERRILWASTGWVPQCEHCQKADKDKTALLAFDLNSGALKQRIESPVKGLLGDMTLGVGGLYVSEGIYGAVLHLAPDATKLERLDTPGEFPSPQTPALLLDQQTLYVPDYVRGIGVMDLSTHEVKWPAPAPDVALTGIDGLYAFRRSFIAVQNGTNPERIVRIQGALQKAEVLEANSIWLGDPTHGTFVGNTFYYIANSGWDSWDNNGKRKPGPPVMSTIRKIELQ